MDKVLLFLVAIYGLYLLGVWFWFPWGEVINTPQRPQFSIEAANGLLPGLLVQLFGLGALCHPPGNVPGAFKQVLGSVGLFVGSDPECGLRECLAQPLFDHSRMYGYGIG